MHAVTKERVIEVLQPVVERPQSAGVLAPRPRDLSGLSVAFLDDNNPNVNILLPKLEALLARRYKLRQVVRCNLAAGRIEIAEPGGAVKEARVATTSILSEVAKECDVAIAGVGH